MSTTETPRLTGTKRDKLGTRYSARIRKDGQLPAVIYGHGEDPLHIAMDAKSTVETLHNTHAHVMEVEVEGKVENVLVKDVQWDYLGKEVLHLDLFRVDLSEEVEVEVALILRGEPAALKLAGAVMNQAYDTVTVSCRADMIPDEITVDVESMDENTPITVGDVKLPDGVTMVTEAELVVVSITIVQEVEETTEGEEGSAEPEVIEKGKSEDAGGE